MENMVMINKRVQVLALFSMGGERTVCCPVRMRYENRDIVFRELGLRHPTTQGLRMIHVFDMSDGTADYRLEFDAERLVWTLIAILEGARI